MPCLEHWLIGSCAFVLKLYDVPLIGLFAKSSLSIIYWLFIPRFDCVGRCIVVPYSADYLVDNRVAVRPVALIRARSFVYCTHIWFQLVRVVLFV